MMRPARPRSVALLNQKGGTGKTTLAVHLAAALALHGPTGLVDLDPQGSSRHWLKLIGRDHSFKGLQAVDGSDQKGGGLDYLVLDCPPSVSDANTLQALAHVDWVLVPVLPSPVDLWASWRLLDTLETIRRVNPGLQARLVINQAEAGSALSNAMHQTMRELGVQALPQAVRKRAVFRSAALEGTVVQRMGRRGAAATADIEAILKELFR